MILLAAAAPPPQGKEAGPIGLVVILILAVAVVLLIRSMNKHLRKVPPSFGEQEPAPTGPAQASSTADPADPEPVDPAR